MADTTVFSRLPRDLLVVLLSTPVAVVGLLALSSDPLRYVLGLLVLLFPLGYAIVSALFPENSAALSIRYSSTDNSGVILQHDLDTLERVALSCGVSIIGVSTLGLAIAFSPLPFRPDVVIPALGTAIVISTVAATWRRLQTPRQERYTPRSPNFLSSVYREFTNPETSVDLALNLLVIGSLLFAAGGSAFVLATADTTGGGTEFYVLTGTGDEQAADSYPRNVTAADSVALDVTVENHAETDREYIVVALLQRVSADGTTERRAELDRFTRQVSADTDWQFQHTFRPRLTGDSVRLQYLLYQGHVPETPGPQNADKDLHLWLNVSEEPAPSTTETPTTTRSPTPVLGVPATQ